MLTLKGLGESGIIRDQEGYELPPNAWTDGNNVRMYQGWVGSVSGASSVISTAAVPYFVTPFYTATTRYLAYACLAKIYVHDGATATDITPVSAPTGAYTDRWTGGVLSGILVLNNGKDVPVYYAGTGVAASLSNWDANWRAKCLRPFKQFLLAGNITKTSTRYPYMLKWSTAADPGAVPTSWDETNPAVDAGEVDLAETPDAIVDMLPLGDNMIVYKERSAYSVTYIGAPYIFRVARLPGELGMLSQNCAVQTPMGHVVLAQGDVYLHAGNEPRSIIDQKARNWLFSNIDDTNYAVSFVTSNPRKQEVWICFPETGQTTCTRALVWNWASDTISMRDLPNATSGCVGVLAYAGNTYDASSGTFDSATASYNDGADFALNDSRLFMAVSSSKIVGQDTGGTFLGDAITSTVTKAGIHADAPDKVKLLSRVWPRIDAQAGVTVSVEVGSSMDAETEPDWQTAQTFTVGTSEKVDCFTSGRYLALRFTSTGQWRMRSCDLEVQVRGSF